MKIDPESMHMVCNYKNKSISELSKNLGITRTRLYKIFEKNSRAKNSTISRIAAEFGISPEVFYLGTPENKKLRAILAFRLLKDGYADKNFSMDDLISFMENLKSKEVEIDIKA